MMGPLHMMESTRVHLIRDAITAAQRDRRPAVSFEFFPPKTEEGQRTLLKPFQPCARRLLIAFGKRFAGYAVRRRSNFDRSPNGGTRTAIAITVHDL